MGAISIMDRGTGGRAAITSAEVAELVGSRHDSVKRAIDRLAEAGAIVRPPVVDEHGVDAMGRPRVTQVYRFAGDQGKRDSIIVVAQLSPMFTARLVDRWQELEAESQLRIPRTLPEALRMAADLAEQNRALEQQVEEQAAQVAALGRIASADGSMCMRDAAKALQVRPLDLRRWLQANAWIYSTPGRSGWVAYQDRIQQGVLCHKVTTILCGETERVVTQVRVTAKGLARLGTLMAGKAVARAG